MTGAITVGNDIDPTPLSPFVAGTNIQFAWDSVSLGLLKECARKYQLTMLDGWRSKDESVHLFFGGEFAAALEHYNHVILEHDFDTALDIVLDRLLVRTWGWDSNHPKKNREILIRSVLWYLFAYENDPVKTVILHDGRPAVELSFRLEVGYEYSNQVDHSSVEFLYCGHMDRIVDYGGDFYVMDQKTTAGGVGAYFFNDFNPDTQMTGYTLASRVIYNAPVKGVIIDAAQIQVGGTHFARGFTMRTNGQLDEWLGDLHHWFDLAIWYAGRNYWPMNDKSCHKYGGCVFLKVCSSDPAVRDNVLETFYEKREKKWNPLEVR